MARYTGPVNRLSRREGVNLMLKSGHRANDKLDKRLLQPPGVHKRGRGKLSDYGVQMREKQKLKRIYGILERQFRIFFVRAAAKKGIKGENLIQLLERRLDNVVFRSFFANTRAEARQMVNHGLILVNGKRVTIPSYTVEPGEKITPHPKEKNIKRVRERLEQYKDLTPVTWLAIDAKTLVSEVLRHPTKADAALPVEESLVVELFSK